MLQNTEPIMKRRRQDVYDDFSVRDYRINVPDIVWRMGIIERFSMRES